MGDENLAVLGALTPVFSLVVLGYLLGRLRFPTTDFWPQAERLTYYLLFPTLLVYKLGSAELPQSELFSVVWPLVGLLGLGSLLALIFARLLHLRGDATTSFYQGAVRFNTYVGLAAAEALFGGEGLVWGAVFVGVMIPLINLCCVLCFALYGGSQATGWRRGLAGVIRNPLILACLLGGLVNISGMGIPAPVAPVMALLSAAALPLGLLAVGVGLNLTVLRRGGRALWLVALYKLLFFPLLLWGLLALTQVAPAAQAVLLLFAMLPTAPSGYILARQLGGDASLMAAIITLQTLLAMLSMPLLMAWIL